MLLRLAVTSVEFSLEDLGSWKRSLLLLCLDPASREYSADRSLRLLCFGSRSSRCCRREDSCVGLCERRRFLSLSLYLSLPWSCCVSLLSRSFPRRRRLSSSSESLDRDRCCRPSTFSCRVEAEESILIRLVFTKYFLTCSL